ncbi:MAG: nucleotidyltransferase domain-containing protein [Vicinamibacterales bacterium]
MGSGRFLLRLPPTLHDHLVARADALGLSLNEYCVRKLGGPEAVGLAEPAALAIRAQAERVVGARLVGLVVHGSFARGEAGTASDVDVLVVVEPSQALTRALYRTWDDEPLSWAGRPVDAHFVHLPAEPDRAGGVWCEAAVDGVVLHDPEGRVEPVLRRIRRAIADRRLVRKRVHGQPYWTEAA